MTDLLRPILSFISFFSTWDKHLRRSLFPLWTSPPVLIAPNHSPVWLIPSLHLRGLMNFSLVKEIFPQNLAVNKSQNYLVYLPPIRTYILVHLLSRVYFVGIIFISMASMFWESSSISSSAENKLFPSNPFVL